MLRFGICDTDTEFLNKLACALHSRFDPCKIEYMYGPSALEVFLRSDCSAADVLITEIELRGKNAINILAANLKASSAMQVLYMTSKTEYCTEVYATRHCGFLLKPIRMDLLERDVKRAIDLLAQAKKDGILVLKNGNAHIVKAPSLIYVEGKGRTIKAITDSEVLEAYEKVTDFAYRLDGRFLQCHKSYIINMERVSRFCGNSFLMDNGATIPISQSRRKAVRDRFLSYVGSASIY